MWGYVLAGGLLIVSILAATFYPTTTVSEWHTDPRCPLCVEVFGPVCHCHWAARIWIVTGAVLVAIVVLALANPQWRGWRSRHVRYEGPFSRDPSG